MLIYDIRPMLLGGLRAIFVHIHHDNPLQLRLSSNFPKLRTHNLRKESPCVVLCKYGWWRSKDAQVGGVGSAAGSLSGLGHHCLPIGQG